VAAVHAGPTGASIMGLLLFLNHLVNLLLPALAVTLICAGAAKGLLWRRALAGVRWRGLCLWPALAGAAVLLGGLLLTGHDGRIGTYGLMCVAIAGLQWWAGFGPGRKVG
jgi:hypothetical protein